LPNDHAVLDVSSGPARPDSGAAPDTARMMPPLPEPVIEQLADLWCELILANLRGHPPAAPLLLVS
jgi:hypothetical protein